MALFAPSESPAVVVKEIDLTGGVPNVQSTTGAMTGNFRWGPVLQRQNIANEAELVATFASPDDTNAIDFLTATQFLRYSSNMVVVRNIDSDGTGNEAASAFTLEDGSASSTGLDNPLILNTTDFSTRQAGLEAVDSGGDLYGFVAKYPGDLGNSLKVSFLPAQSSDSAWDLWDYNGSFDARPETSTFAQANNATYDEMHVVIVDEDGKFSGTRGTVLETFPNLSILKGAKNTEGSSIYAKDVINATSQYAWLINFNSALDSAGAGDTVTSGTSYLLTGANRVATDISFSNGANSGTLKIGAHLSGNDLFEDRDQVEVDFLIAPNFATATDQRTVVNDLVATAQQLRKDCMVVSSPNRDAILSTSNDATRVTNTVATVSGFTKSSYLVVDNNFVKVYDKYNDKYVDIAAASTVAGIMAATDYNRAPWFSPAGTRRGQLLGITSIAYSPTKGQRDTLYKAGVNPIANIPGQGVLLFGDKTFLGRVSAFDRINVRRLFLVLERAIGRAAEQVMFEFNDEFTRAEFVNIIEPVLREVKGRRGISDFRVVCDETNNTGAVIDRNEFIANVFIKPARSINYVSLNFVAVRTGVDFEEVVGTV